MYVCHLLSELSWLAEGRSCARLESAVELCAGRVEGRCEEGAEAPLVLMFRDGDSGFGVEEADEAEEEGRRKEKVFKDSKQHGPRKMVFFLELKAYNKYINQW